jgi:hypothetical protein
VGTRIREGGSQHERNRRHQWIQLRIRLEIAESDASSNAELSANADSSAFLGRTKYNRINTLVWRLYCRQECEVEEINLYGE